MEQRQNEMNMNRVIFQPKHRSISSFVIQAADVWPMMAQLANATQESQQRRSECLRQNEWGGFFSSLKRRKKGSEATKDTSSKQGQMSELLLGELTGYYH